MNPHVFARAECANYMVGGCFDNGPCKLKTAGARCAYFEKCVLPYELKRPDLYHGTGKEYWTAAAKASGMHPATVKQAIEAGDARLCRCGEPLLPRHRLCDNCANKNKREAYRKHQRSKQIVKPVLV